MPVPSLPALDLDESVRVYMTLGFAIHARYAEHAFVILTRSGNHGPMELHLCLAEDPDSPENSSLSRWVADARQALGAFVAAGIAHAGSRPERKPFGQWEIALTDPAGRLTRVGSPVD